MALRGGEVFHHRLYCVVFKDDTFLNSMILYMVERSKGSGEGYINDRYPLFKEGTKLFNVKEP